MIEWREEFNNSYLEAHVGGERVATISSFFPTCSSEKMFKLYFFGKEVGRFPTLEAAKAKGEELLAAWVDEAGLMIVPESKSGFACLGGCAATEDLIGNCPKACPSRIQVKASNNEP